MNVYTGLLFLHGHILDANAFADAPEYGPSFGNQVANERGLRDRWERERRQHHRPAVAAAGREDDIDGTPRAA
jgi:hypothetical protein